jgi:uncharacterized protein
MTRTGQNVWFDLMTTDVEGAKAFYGETIGWKTKQWEDADPAMPYTMWTVGDTPVGGVMPLHAEAKQMGAPPHWIAYTTVQDVDAAVSKAQQLGGRVYAPAMDIPKVGRFAILGDPQGATFAVFKPTEPSQAPPDQVGHFSWAELNTTDYEAAWKFYSQLFDWKHKSSMDMGPGLGTYFMWNDQAEKTKGGMSNTAKQMGVPPHWLHYVTVDSCEQTIERIKRAGGKVLNGPMPVPGDDVIAQCQDPQGAFFAIYSRGKK